MNSSDLARARATSVAISSMCATATSAKDSMAASRRWTSSPPTTDIAARSR